MKAMIMAAGLGTRMGELTNNTPKPLLKIGDKTLIEHQIIKLESQGFDEIVINVHYHAQQIINHLGDGSQYGVSIAYSIEEELLEVGGGIRHALPLLGDEPFVLVNSDIWTDYPFGQLSKSSRGKLQLLPGSLAHLILVDNPEHNPNGDFAIRDGVIFMDGEDKLTYSGIALFHPQFFAAFPEGHCKLIDMLAPRINQGKVTAEHYHGSWMDVGRPENLTVLNESVS